MKNVTVIILTVLTGCTFAPKPVVHQSESAWISSHVLGYDSKGLYVDAEWVRAYQGMYLTYGEQLPIRQQTSDIRTGVQPWGKYFHVTYEVNHRFAELTYLEENSIH